MRALNAIERLNLLFGILSGLAIFAITIIVMLDVAMRAAFNAPVPGTTELSTLLLVGLIYLGLASVQSRKQNYRVEIMIGFLPPRPRLILEGVTTLLSAVAVGILAWFTSIEAWNATLAQEMSFGAIIFPVWPARVIVAGGLILLTLQLLLDVLRICTGSSGTKITFETAESGSLRE